MSSFAMEIGDLEFGYEPEKSVIRIDYMMINPGEVTAFRGGNGTGKTTLMKIIAGLMDPWTGKIVCYKDRKICPRQEFFRNAVYVHQEPYILKGSVYQNIALLLSGIDGRGREKLVEQALNMVGLSGFQKKRASALSGGEKKRLALSRALAAGKEILLLDEPTANVDAENTALLEKHLDDFREKGMTVILATHDRDFAGRADRVYNFVDGSIS